MYSTVCLITLKANTVQYVEADEVIRRDITECPCEAPLNIRAETAAVVFSLHNELMVFTDFLPAHIHFKSHLLECL